MNPVSLFQHRYEWTPSYRLVSKKPVPTELKTFRVEQTKGVQGWLLFTYDNTTPVCYWVNSHEYIQVPCIVDERICGDTVLRVEKLSELEYVVADIWMYNSNCVFVCSTFEQRYNWLKRVLNEFTTYVDGVTIELIHKSELEPGYYLKGYEDYPCEPGKNGYFTDKIERGELLSVVKLAIPDCYEIVGKGYLHVPDLKTSVYLRSKGESFQSRCIPWEDGYWQLLENIPEIE
jgi:hypothetical protein